MPVQSDKIELALLEGKTFQLDLNALCIIAYDSNHVSATQMRQLVDHLMASGKMGYPPALLGYDGYVCDNPLKIYEVKHADTGS